MAELRATDPSAHVPESKFGIWFLRTQTWESRVLDVAVRDLEKLIKHRKTSYPVIVDIGCGSGQSFRRLKDSFSPELIIGGDINPDMLRSSAREAKRLGVDVKLIQGNSASLALADQSVDMVFCHQTFHHLNDHESSIREFRRVLKPGGLLLFAESTRVFIHSWIIRLLFSHPMEVQKSASEYLEFIADAGFSVDPDSVSYPYLWWSRADLGIRESVFRIPPASAREETLLNVAAVRI